MLGSEGNLMWRCAPVLLASVLMCVLVAPAEAADDEYWQQDVHYTIDVRLDTKSHMLNGSETIVYKNHSPDTLDVFYLHLYPNAYKDKNTALIKDARRHFNYSLIDLPKRYRSYLNIDGVTIDGIAVSPEIDGTIAKIDLPNPILPGGEITLALRFEEKVRQHLGRAGYRGDHYDLAQWYPKVVVYDDNGWHPDQFRMGEFYGEFGTFDVRIDVPEHFVVAATGIVTEGDPGWDLNSQGKNEKSDKYKSVRFHAEKVHDFAWSTDPKFVVQDSTWNGIDIKSFYKRNNKDWQDTTLVHGVRAMEWLNERVGVYPYPQVSIVQALLGGGMEYPMLVMDGRVSEGLVLHEIGHIYFFGILANNERTEAWLDEGFTTFQTNWYMIQRYGPYGDTSKWNWYQRITPQYTRQEDLRRHVFPLLRRGYGERIATRAEDFKHSYYNMVYRKAALMFFALQYVVGEETFDKILREYYAQWQLKHVNEERFRQVCEDVSGMDLGWFFEGWLHTRKICDYRLSKVKTRPSEKGDGYTSEVTIERRGELTMPLKLRFSFKSGHEETVRLDGRLRTILQEFDFPEKPERIALNPENEIGDINLSDNFVPRRRDYQFRWPNNDFQPDGAYQLRWYPMAWHNDVDGAYLWFDVSTRSANRSHRASLSIYYGVDSRRLDFAGYYFKPSRFFNENVESRLSGYKRQGRQDLTIGLHVQRRKELLRPPTHNFDIGFNYHELADTRYVNTEFYQTGSDVAPYFTYSVNPQLDIASTRINLGLRLGREWFGGRFKYTSFHLDASMRTRPVLIPADMGLRLFFGRVAGSMPLQEKFFLANGGPLTEEEQFFLRAPGSIPYQENYHAPGHGNLRGYQIGNFGVNRLLTLNYDLAANVPLLSKSPNKLLGRIRLMAFADVGWIFDSNNPNSSSARIADLVEGGVLDQTLFDGGIGITLQRNLALYKLFFRFDVPFYVNHPEVNGESVETRYRYVFSLKAIF